MKADDKLQILKFFLMLFNSVFVILGISIFACSAWILFDKDNFIRVISSGEEVKLVAGGLFVTGLVVVGVSLLGCIGAYLENRCLITFYLSFSIIIIVGQIFITFVLLIRRQSIEQYLTNSVDSIIKHYGENETHETSWNLLDSVQRSAKCCGRLTPDEWKNNTVIQSLYGTDIYPCSCFNGTCPIISEAESFGNGSHIYETDCETVLRGWLDTNIIVIFGMNAGLLLIQVLQLIFGVYTYKCIGRKMRELHPNKLLNAVDESPSSEPVYHQSVDQTYNPVMDSGQNHGGYYEGGYDNGEHDHSGYDNGGYYDGGYDQFGSDHGGYARENYDQYKNHDNIQTYNTPHNQEYQQGYNDRRYMQNDHHSYNHDDY